MAEADGFAEFVSARYGALVRTAFLFVGDRDAAEDLVQTALFRTYKHWDRLRSRDAGEAYTRKTMARLAGRWSRRRWHGELPSEDVGGHDTVDPVPLRADALDLYAALDLLPRGQRCVLVLRYFEDLSEADTAVVLRCSPGTVKSRASRALATLRARLGPEVIGEDESPRRESRHG